MLKAHEANYISGKKTYFKQTAKTGEIVIFANIPNGVAGPGHTPDGTIAMKNRPIDLNEEMVPDYLVNPKTKMTKEMNDDRHWLLWTVS